MFRGSTENIMNNNSNMSHYTLQVKNSTAGSMIPQGNTYMVRLKNINHNFIERIY